MLNLKVVLLYLREKLLTRAQRDRHTEALAAGSQADTRAADEAAEARRQEAQAKMAHFNGLPEADRQAYLATARTKHPTAKSEAFIEGIAVTAAWAEYETSEDEVTA